MSTMGRILTTHTGSLPRPAEFLPKLLAREDDSSAGAIEVDDATKEAVAKTVRAQEQVGIDVLNDGEMSKPSYATYIRHRLSGVSDDVNRSEMWMEGYDEFPDFAEQRRQTLTYMKNLRFTICDGPVTYVGHAALQADIDNLRTVTQATPAAGVFMTAASPGVISLFTPNRYYPTQEEYLCALAEAMRTEYDAIHEAGYVLQVDCPDLAMAASRAGSLENFRRQMELSVEALNLALRNVPAEAARVHVCWGNAEKPRTTDVELKDIIDIILKAKPAGIMLMASNGRHAHEWKVFRDTKLPEGKYIIPGVIDSTTNIVEHPEVVAERLIRYAEVVGRDNVMAGTDCGFGTVAGKDVVVPTVIWAKFRAQTQGAKIASEYLWS
jgi:5-methyltetrahydropteroyltriglutamate--homocysteine methyltransferase